MLLQLWSLEELRLVHCILGCSRLVSRGATYMIQCRFAVCILVVWYHQSVCKW